MGLAKELRADEKNEDGTYLMTGFTGSLRFMVRFALALFGSVSFSSHPFQPTTIYYLVSSYILNITGTRSGQA